MCVPCAEIDLRPVGSIIRLIDEPLVSGVTKFEVGAGSAIERHRHGNGVDPYLPRVK